jgi:outer membrane protein OmpA-like peptidoglycan-associated protein/sugar lactone lactonase YvrE
MKKITFSILITTLFYCGIFLHAQVITIEVSNHAGSGIQGFKDGPASTAQIDAPNGLTVDSYDNVYFSDMGNHRVRKITKGYVTTLAGSNTSGLQDGKGEDAKFNGPTGLCVDKQGNIIVADYYNHCIRKISPDGYVVTIAGSGRTGYVEGTGRYACFNYPIAVACDSKNNIYVADTYNNAIRKISPSGEVTTFVGDGRAGYKDGDGRTARISTPLSLSMDMYDNLYIVDSKNKAIRKVSPSGMVSTLIDSKFSGFVDSTKSVLNLSFTTVTGGGGGVLVEPDGHNLYIADGGTHSVIRINLVKKLITVLAGNGQPGFKNGDNKTARFNDPVELGIDKERNLYVADYRNESIRKIKMTRKTDPEEIKIVKEKGLTINVEEKGTVIEQDKKPEKPEYKIKGMVYEAKTKTPMSVDILIEETHSKIKPNNLVSSSEGKYDKVLPAGEYKISVNKEGYMPFAENFCLPKEKLHEIEIDIPLAKIEVGATIQLKHIHFGPNSADLTPDSMDEIKRLADFLRKHPKTVIQIDGHTDKGGSDDFNMKLSTQRARAVMVALVKEGVADKQVRYKGFGNTKPIASNDTPEGRRLNRRTEFEIVSQ